MKCLKTTLALLVVMSLMTLNGCDRIQYHMQGQEGPYSYKFGYDTGPGQGYARQFRHEEMDGYGVVHGKYGYYDVYGKPVVVHYTAHPKHGFKVLKGH